MTDLELLEEARENARILDCMAAAHESMVYAIDAHIRGMNQHCWSHLLDRAMFQDEARGLLAKALRR